MSATDVEQYLEALRLSDVVRDRVSEVLAAFDFLCSGAELERVFIAETATDDGRRRLESVWGFAGENWMEARNFQRRFDVDISPYKKSIYYIGMQYEKVGFNGEVDEASRMSVEVSTDKVEYSTLSAVGLNCSYLIGIIRDFLLPNLRGS